MDDNEVYTSSYMMDKYNEKINSVGYKLKQAIGHPYEQMRLVMQLKIYINSMINDLTKLDDKYFVDDSDSFDSINKLYELTYGILTSITSTSSGISMDVTGSDTEVVMTKDSKKDAIIQKYKLMLAGIDKIMRYLDTLNKPAKESTFFEEIDIADEAALSYRIMRKAQTNSLALAHQLSEQKKTCSNKYNECKGHSDMEASFKNWLLKQKAAVQRKINGKEIKNKKALQKFITLYDSYLNKLGSVSNESFITEIMK